MRFGGHETFSIRYGWLYKGLSLAIKNPEMFSRPDLFELLGVGKNMAKAIRHWLLASGLVELAVGTDGKKILQPTALGKVIWKRDKYFVLPGTWWVVHMNLMHSLEHSYTWHWFFNYFGKARFERATCIEGLRRYLAQSGQRMASSRTLDRDVACFLKSYAVQIPSEPADPEESLDCPLRELGLLVHSTQTGFFHLDQSLKAVPYELFSFAVDFAMENSQTSGTGKKVDLSLTEIATNSFMPGRVFCLSSEATYELLAQYESSGLLKLINQAGERLVSMPRMDRLKSLEAYYDRMLETGEVAA